MTNERPATELLVAPGAVDACAAGCICPTVANLGYRSGTDPYPLLDPRCPLHGDRAGVVAAGGRPDDAVLP